MPSAYANLTVRSPLNDGIIVNISAIVLAFQLLTCACSERACCCVSSATADNPSVQTYLAMG